VPEDERERRRVGLCLDCWHAQRMKNDRGSIFFRCTLAETDPAFAKYPRLPVVRCSGYQQLKLKADE